jgi:hypothetical protein
MLHKKTAFIGPGVTAKAMIAGLLAKTCKAGKHHLRRHACGKKWAWDAKDR